MRGLALWMLLLAGTAHAQTPLDLGALIEQTCGPEGYKWNAGCHITLPKGVLVVGPTEIGHCGSTTARVGLTIEGQGAGMPATQPPFPMAATVLQYAGPAGKPVLSFCGVSNLALRDLAIDGAGLASVGVRLSANNAQSGIAHFSDLERLTITRAGKGVEVTGEGKNDQTDFVSLRGVSITQVDTGYWQDSQQSVNGKLTLVESIARRESFHIGGGSLDCDGCYAANAPGSDASYIGFHATKSDLQDGRNFSHHQIAIRNGHSEIQVGRGIVGDVLGNLYPLLVSAHSWSIQCQTPSCELTLVEWRGGSPPVLQANVVQGSTPHPEAPPSGRFCSPSGWRNTGNVRKGEVKALVWGCK
jgi:hypothetical protein